MQCRDAVSKICEQFSLPYISTLRISRISFETLITYITYSYYYVKASSWRGVVKTLDKSIERSGAWSAVHT
jgi:hypothetical protein